jgi:hypothetical protein
VRQWIGSRLTFANVVSLAALFVALGGTATAVTYVVSSNSQVGPNTISGHTPPSGKHANLIPASVNGQDVADNSLRGADVNESTLGQVPSATKANDAFSTWHDGEIPMPDSISAPTNPIKDLNIPHAGSYVINATLEVRDRDTDGSSAHSRCVLAAGQDSDTKYWDYYVHYENAAFQVVHTFDSPGLVTLSCSDQTLSDVVVSQLKITAIQVNNLTNG